MTLWHRRKKGGRLELSPFDPESGTVTVGLCEDGSPAILRLANQSGMVVGGLPGSGKTAGMMVVVLALLRAGARVHVIDGKGGTEWDWTEGAASLTGDDIDMAHDALLSLDELMKERLASMRREYGASNYWNVPADSRPPLEVVVIDECQTFFDLKGVLGGKEVKAKATEITAAATDIVKKGRSAGFLLIAMTQKPTADSIPTALRDNCGIRICFRVATSEAARSVLGDGRLGSADPTAIPANRQGGAVLCKDDGSSVMCRFAYLAEDAAAKAAAEL